MNGAAFEVGVGHQTDAKVLGTDLIGLRRQKESKS
jgi:hypothetical protein